MEKPSSWINNPIINALDRKLSDISRWVNDDAFYCLTKTLTSDKKKAIGRHLLKNLNGTDRQYSAALIQEFAERKLHKYRPYILNNGIHFSGGDHIGVYQKFISVSKVRDEGDMFASPTIDESVTEKRKLIAIKKAPTS